MSKDIRTSKKIKYVNEPTDVYEIGYCLGPDICAPSLDGSTRENCCNK